MKDFKHKKKWGQNFLRNEKAVLDMITQLHINNNDNILEIGPGKGILTEFILHNVKYTQIVEIDPNLVTFLTNKFKQYTNTFQGHKLEIKNKNILDIDKNELRNKYKINKIIGSLPYNISKKILQDFFADYNLKFDRGVFLIQKQVAHKIAAIRKGHFLNHYFNIYNDIYLIKDIEKSFFFPIPKVDGSIIVFIPKERNKIEIKKEIIPSYIKFLKNIFRNKRKKLVKNLNNIYKNINWINIFNNLNLPLNTRAEELTHQQVFELFNNYNLKIKIIKNNIKSC